jgi:hypothetical protein
MRQRILATGVFAAGLCEAGGSRWSGVTTRLSSSKSGPGYNFRERLPESVGAPYAWPALADRLRIAAANVILEQSAEQILEHLSPRFMRAEDGTIGPERFANIFAVYAVTL